MLTDNTPKHSDCRISHCNNQKFGSVKPSKSWFNQIYHALMQHVPFFRAKMVENGDRPSEREPRAGRSVVPREKRDRSQQRVRPYVLAKTNGSFSRDGETCLRGGRRNTSCALVGGVPTHVVVATRRATSFMNDELIWDVTRAFDS